MQIKWFISALLIIAMAGCRNDDKKPSQKELVTQQWNAARAGVLYGLAKDQYATGNFDKSRQTIEEALAMDPRNPALHILSAKLAIEQGQLEAADRELKLARQFDPNNAEAEYLSGVVYQRWQQPQLAYECYQRAGEKAPAELAYLLARAEMLVLMDRLPEALSLLQEKVIYFEHSAAIRDAVGQLLLQQGQYADAAAMLRQASILSTDDPAIREHLALALYYAGQYQDAADVLARLVTAEPYSQRADLLMALGECRMQAGQTRDARDSFETASRLDPSSAAAWLSLGKAALQLNDFRRADLSLRKALSLEPASSEGYLMLGYLRLRQDQLQEALSAFQKANALDRGDTVSLCMIGYALEKSGRTDQAIDYYGRALKIKPNDDLASQLMAGLDVGE